MSEFINTIDQLCDDVVLGNIIDGRITEFKDNMITSVGSYSFETCSNLTIVDLPNVTSIGYDTFNGCSKLSKLILRSNTVCTLSSASSFTSTPIKNGTGFIYVNDDLKEQYKSATNWSTYANQIKGISELGE